jgi:hypothetical protein
MNAKRMFYVLIGCLVVFIGIGIAALVVGNGILQKESDNLVGLKLRSQALNEQQTALAKARQDIAKYDELNRIAQIIVPQEKDQAGTVRELTAYANKAGIKIGSITFPASNLGAKAVAGASATAAKGLSQVSVVPGIAGVYQMPITIQSDANSPIDFSRFVTFLGFLENNRHTAQVSQVSITPADGNGRRLSFVITVNVYIKP